MLKKSVIRSCNTPRTPPLTPITCTDPFMSMKSGLVNLLLYCFSMLKLYIRSFRSITHFVYPPPPHLHITSQGCLIVYLQILDIRSCMQVFFPCFLSQKKTYDVYQNIYWIIYWNQISGLVTHQAHHAQGCLSSKYWKPIMIFNVEISYQVLQHITLIPLTPITCTDPFMSIVEIRSCKPFTVLLFRCWNHILGLVDLSLTRWNQVL